MKKSIDMITDIAEDSEKYLKFYEQFSKNLKVRDISCEMIVERRRFIVI